MSNVYLKHFESVGDSRENVIKSALRVAAEHYAAIAKEHRPHAERYEAAGPEIRAKMEEASPMVHPRTYRYLVDQMDLQAKEALEAMEWLEGEDLQGDDGDFIDKNAAPIEGEFVICRGFLPY